MGLEFYSSRSERLESASSATKLAYEQRKKRGVFAKNPQLKFLVIDLIIILIFAVIILPFFLKLTKDERFDDYKVVSKAVFFEEKILVSVKISKLFKKINKRIATDSVNIVIFTDNDDNIYLEKESLLPTQSGEEIYVTFKLNDEKDLDYIYINLSSGEYNKKRKVLIER